MPARSSSVWVKLGGGAAADDIHFYGLPLFGRFGLKIARFVASGDPVDPDAVDRAVGEDAAAAPRAFLARHIPAAAAAPLVAAHTCLFTMTPDEDFVIDLYPGDPRIAVGAGFSGHGSSLLRRSARPSSTSSTRDAPPCARSRRTARASRSPGSGGRRRRPRPRRRRQHPRRPRSPVGTSLSR